MLLFAERHQDDLPQQDGLAARVIQLLQAGFAQFVAQAASLVDTDEVHPGELVAFLIRAGGAPEGFAWGQPVGEIIGRLKCEPEIFGKRVEECARLTCRDETEAQRATNERTGLVRLGVPEVLLVVFKSVCVPDGGVCPRAVCVPAVFKSVCVPDGGVCPRAVCVPDGGTQVKHLPAGHPRCAAGIGKLSHHAQPIIGRNVRTVREHPKAERLQRIACQQRRCLVKGLVQTRSPAAFIVIVHARQIVVRK